ncbi:MAG: TetR/AcrR family transcriptional regulator [Treponema sp.]|nr:TetR/AcrR family transcriptional regulator [Treponema sp.]
MENFFRIRAEKQDHIIKAAFMVFGRQGYRKASVADVAKEAGITKGMITYYFGSKKNLYLYLLEFSHKSVVQAVKDLTGSDNIDFFERLKNVTLLQVEAIKKYPAQIGFITSSYYETDPEVAQDVARICADEDDMINSMLLEGVDFSRFKPGVDPRLLCKFSLWASSGIFEELFNAASAEKAEELTAEFFQCLDLMRRTFQRKGA